MVRNTEAASVKSEGTECTETHSQMCNRSGWEFPLESFSKGKPAFTCLKCSVGILSF